jgi:23S rRNA (adenine2503-C2)-methyltransferase
VLIPSAAGDRTTLCVSSQVGCRQACSFCATGAMGLLRSLEADEILAQLFEAVRLARAAGLPPVRNVVFMGMGEPLDNAPAVRAALEVMTHDLAFGLAKRHVCVSTVGPSPAALEPLVAMPARLAWSVHAADDALRRLLVPTTAHPMAELRDAFADVLRRRPDANGLFVEVTLIDGVNDGAAHARQLVELLRPLPGKTKVNLIPYNANAGLGAAGALFQPSPPEAIDAFACEVLAGGLVCTKRTTRGDAEASACGMLATSSARAASRDTARLQRDPVSDVA